MAHYYFNKDWPFISAISTIILPHYFSSIKFHFNIIFLPFLSTAQQLLVGHGFLIIQASPSHSDTPNSLGLLWKSDRPHNTHPSQEIDLNALDGIRNCNPSKGVIVDLPLRPSGHWGTLPSYLLPDIPKSFSPSEFFLQTEISKYSRSCVLHVKPILQNKI
jgi:hypothetical protein